MSLASVQIRTDAIGMKRLKCTVLEDISAPKIKHSKEEVIRSNFTEWDDSKALVVSTRTTNHSIQLIYNPREAGSNRCSLVSSKTHHSTQAKLFTFQMIYDI